MPQNYKISPSEMTFLYEECKHCFVNKVKHGIGRPSIPIPGIFSTIASLQKEFHSDKRTEDFCPELPPGKVVLGEKWVQSRQISFDGIQSTCYIKGRFDVVMELDDGTYLIGDFKTGKPSAEKTEMYSRQLHAYSYSLENPDGGSLSLGPISTLGLLYFTPDTYAQLDLTRQTLEGNLTWVEVERNDEFFMQFMKNVLVLLDGDSPPSDPENCSWCKYRSLTGDLSGESIDSDQKSTAPACPDCGGPMQLRSGRFGEFWSCLKYPDCKGTRNP
jgi:hypothetical protein